MPESHVVTGRIWWAIGWAGDGSRDRGSKSRGLAIINDSETVSEQPEIAGHCMRSAQHVGVHLFLYESGPVKLTMRHAAPPPSGAVGLDSHDAPDPSPSLLMTEAAGAPVKRE